MLKPQRTSLSGTTSGGLFQGPHVRVGLTNSHPYGFIVKSGFINGTPSRYETTRKIFAGPRIKIQICQHQPLAGLTMEPEEATMRFFSLFTALNDLQGDKHVANYRLSNRFSQLVIYFLASNNYDSSSYDVHKQMLKNTR